MFNATGRRIYQGIIEEDECAGYRYVVKKYLSYYRPDDRFPTSESYDVEIAGKTYNFISENDIFAFLQGFEAAHNAR